MIDFRFKPFLGNLDERIVPDSAPTTPDIVWLDHDTFQVGDLTFDINPSTSDENVENLHSQDFQAQDPRAAKMVFAEVLEKIPEYKPPTATDLKPPVDPQEKYEGRKPTESESQEITKLSALLEKLKAKENELRNLHKKLGEEHAALEADKKRIAETLVHAQDVLKLIENQLLTVTPGSELEKKLLDAAAQQRLVVKFVKAKVQEVQDQVDAKTKEMNKVVEQIKAIHQKMFEVEVQRDSILLNIRKGGLTDAHGGADTETVLDTKKINGQPVNELLP
jgi:hypothetical protein